MENLGTDSDYYLKNLVALKMTEKYYLSPNEDQIQTFPLEIKNNNKQKRTEIIDMENHKY